MSIRIILIFVIAASLVAQAPFVVSAATGGNVPYFDGQSSAGGMGSYVVTFSEPVRGVDVTDFTIDSNRFPVIQSANRSTKGLKLSSTGAYVRHANYASIPTQDITVELWVKGTLAAPQTAASLVSYAVSANSNELTILATTNTMSVYMNTSLVLSQSGINVLNNEWHHVAFVRDWITSTQSSIYLFVDGNFVGSAIVLGSPAAALTTGGTITLGQRPTAVTPTLTFDAGHSWAGTFGVFRVWNVALTAASVTQAMASAASFSLSNMSIYWEFDAIISGTTIKDIAFSSGVATSIQDGTLSPTNTGGSIVEGEPFDSKWLVAFTFSPGVGGYAALKVLDDGTIVDSFGTDLGAPWTMPTFTPIFVPGYRPVITAVTPNSGPTIGGNTVNIYGTAFNIVTSTILGGSPVSFNRLSDTQIQFIAPPHDIGSPLLSLQSPVGSSVPASYVYTPTLRNVPADYPTVEAAISASNSGDIIDLAPGVYPVHSLNFQSKLLSIRGTAGAARTILDGQSNGTILAIDTALTTAHCIAGLTFLNGHPTTPEQPGALFLINASPTVKDCRFISNFGTRGGAVFVVGGAPRFDRCVFVDNHSLPEGTVAGVDVNSTLNARFSECVFYGNGPVDESLSNQGAMRFFNTVSTTIRNCVVYGNVGNYGGGIGLYSNQNMLITHSIIRGNMGFYEPNIYLQANTNLVVKYCNLEPQNVQNSTFVPTDSFDGDPLFRDPANRDFRLRPNSMCINRGQSMVTGMATSDFEGEPRRVGSAIDVGVDEYVRPPYEGTGDGIDLDVSIAGVSPNGTLTQEAQRIAHIGDTLSIHFYPTNDLYLGGVPILGGQVFATGLPPTPFDVGFVLNPTVVPAPVSIFDGANVPTPWGPVTITLPSDGLTIVTEILPGFDGFSLLLQAYVLSPNALNGVIAASAGTEIMMMP